ncbi:hypothetical protein FKM82_030858, partial [Ascaphus truei]
PQSPVHLALPVTPSSSVPLPLEETLLPPLGPVPQSRPTQEQLPMVQTVPSFLLQHQEKDWFTRVCPEVKAELHQVSEGEFESRLLRGVLSTDLPMCTGILQTLSTLHQQGKLRDLRQTQHTLIRAIKPSHGLNLKVMSCY